MFGNSYSYKKQPKILDDGIYEVILELPFEIKVENSFALRFPFRVKGESGPVVPNHFDLFNCTETYNYFKISQFRRTASEIKACFKLKGSFSSENYAKWVGCKGRIRIKKCENGFSNVTYFYKRRMAKYED